MPFARGARRSGVVLTLSLVVWIGAVAPPAYAGGYGGSVTCAYDAAGPGTVTVTITPDSYAYVGLTRSAAGDVGVQADEAPLSCTGGDDANPATSVVVNGAGDGLDWLTIWIENWTSETSITVDGPPVDVAPEGSYGVSLYGTEGADAIDSGSLAFAVSAASVSCLEILGLGGNDEIVMAPASPVAPIIAGCALLNGGAGDDTLTNGLPADPMGWYRPFVVGDAGMDTLQGGEAAEYLAGGDGDDVLLGGGGADSLDGEAGDDLLYGGPGNDYVDGGYEYVCRRLCLESNSDGDDRLFGEAGDDYLFYGGGGADLLDGGADDDFCQGFAADGPPGKFARVDYVDCDRGEVFVASCTYDPTGDGAIEVTVSGSGAVAWLLRDPEGSVTVKVGEYGPGEFDASYPDGPGLMCAGGDDANPARSVVLNGAGDGWTDVYVYTENWSPDTSIVLNDPDTSPDDYDFLGLVGSEGPDVIDASDPGFSLTGGPFTCFFLFGLGGDDTLIAGTPPGVGIDRQDCGDSLLGGAGDDTLWAGDIGMFLAGGKGDDVLHGGPQSNGISGGAGDDVLHGGDGGDQLIGGAGDDLVYGEGGEDFLLLTPDGEYYSGTVLDGGRDILDGGADADFCEGYSGGSPAGDRGDRVYSRTTYVACEYSNDYYP